MKRNACVALLAIVLGLFLAFVVSFAQSETRWEDAPNRKNSLGVSDHYENQYSYMFGTVLHTDEIGGRVTNVSFQPYGSSLIYTENVLFCDDVTGHFEPGTMVIATYRKTATRMYRQVACHDVFKVIMLELPKEDGQ